MIQFPASEPTPAVIINKPRVAARIAAVHESVRAKDSTLVPMVKTSGVLPEVIKMQAEDGKTTRFACVTAEQAKLLVDLGYKDIVVAKPMIDGPSLDVIRELTDTAGVKIAVVLSSPEHFRIYHKTFGFKASSPDVYVEIEVGSKRTGFNPEDEATLGVVEQIHALINGKVRGILAYAGFLYNPGRNAKTPSDVRTTIKDFREALEKRGFPRTLLAAIGSTPATYDFRQRKRRIDELFAGGYVFEDYSGVLHEFVDPSKCAVTIAARIDDLPTERQDEMVLGVGQRILNTNHGPFGEDPETYGAIFTDDTCTRLVPHANIVRASAEVCTVRLPDSTMRANYKTGDLVRILPRRSESTIRGVPYVLVEDASGITSERWEPQARGVTPAIANGSPAIE